MRCVAAVSDQLQLHVLRAAVRIETVGGEEATEHVLLLPFPPEEEVAVVYPSILNNQPWRSVGRVVFHDREATD